MIHVAWRVNEKSKVSSNKIINTLIDVKRHTTFSLYDLIFTHPLILGLNFHT